jgi:NADH dehydrogenase
MAESERRHRVVVIGGGFGGLQAVQHLQREPVDITLIDRRNFHLFQPLTYQVATGALSPGEVAYPLRAIFKRRRNVRVFMAEVTGFDLEARQVQATPVEGGLPPITVPYDTLIVGGGSRYSYFGHDEWERFAPEVKSLESALAARSRIFEAFEAAELDDDPDRRRRRLTFVVVGAGPTGVEIAGQIAELARDTLRRDFREIDSRDGDVLLIEAADRVLGTFPESLSRKAQRALEHLGATVLLNRSVVAIDADGVAVESPDGATERIAADTVIWAAGVTASALARQLAELTGAELDRAGRITVEPDLTLPGHPEVFALGDMIRMRRTDGEVATFPGVAPVAMQEGRYAAKVVRARLRGRPSKPFHYLDKGNLATIGRARAVADIKGLRLSGLLAWLIWLTVHLFYLVGFQNRVLVFIRWSVSFATHGRGARLITDAAPDHGSAQRAVAEDGRGKLGDDVRAGS